MAKQQVGLVGLAVMGQNLALNIESKGFSVAVFNRTGAKTERLSYKETRLLTQLEEDIPRMEERIQALHEEVVAVGADYQKLHALSSEQAELTLKLEAAMEQWERLASRAAAAGQM